MSKTPLQNIPMMETGRQIGHKYESKERTDDVDTKQSVTFDELLLSDNVLKGLKSSGFLTPSPIQLKAIPLGRCGLDMVVQAKSGTGKTCVFSVIALESMEPHSPSLQAVVLAPTREIALQIHSVMTGISCYIQGLKIEVFIGGTEVSKDRIKAKKCHIAIGSPGRIKQLIELEILLVKHVRLFVLDEADKLVDEGTFQTQINWIYSSLPANKQMLAVSATYPEVLAQFLKCYMCQPQFVRLNPTDPSLLGLRQYYYVVGEQCLPYIMFERKTQGIIELLTTSTFQQALVFSNFHTRAHGLSEALNSAGWPSTYISSNLQQSHRIEAINKLKEFKCRVLISTDLTSRGIDAYHVDLVVNMDIPPDWETYMHRIGRAGRYGSRGVAVTLIGSLQEEERFLELTTQCNATVVKLSCLSEIHIQSASLNQMETITDLPNIDTRPVESKLSEDTSQHLNSNNHTQTEGDSHSIDRDTETDSSSLTEDECSTSSSQYSDETIEEKNQSQVALPTIPSLAELMQTSLHLRQNLHLQSMSSDELKADFAYYVEHGEFAPPPERLRNSPVNDEGLKCANAKTNGFESIKSDENGALLRNAEVRTNSQNFRSQKNKIVLPENGVSHENINGMENSEIVVEMDSVYSKPAAHVSETATAKYTANVNLPTTQHGRATYKIQDYVSNSSTHQKQEVLVPDMTNRGSTDFKTSHKTKDPNSPQKSYHKSKTENTFYEFDSEHEDFECLEEETEQKANAAQTSCHEYSPTCSHCHCVSPWVLYEDDQEFCEYVYRRALWHARQYVHST